LTEAVMKQIAFFVQDTWRITPRFTLTAGFRWEGYVNPQPEANNTSLVNKVKNFPNFPLGFTVDPTFIPNNYRQYMPRVGIAWDPAGNAKTVIRASAGFFYAPTPLLLFSTPLNNFRLPAGDLTVQLPFSLTGAPTGTPCLAKNTVYCQFNLIGIDLNQSKLDNLPILTPAQLTAIAQKLFPTGLPDPFIGATTLSLANNYESPRSWQWSAGMEHEIRRGWSVGADFVYVNTIHLERNRDLNLPLPILFQGATITDPKTGASFTFGPDLTLRPCFGVVGRSVCTPTQTVKDPTDPTGKKTVTLSVPTRARPIPTLSDVAVRTTDARALYRGFTVRTNYRRSRMQFQASYTLSYNYSTDDNERLSSGYDHDNEFNLVPEYGFSRLDARHQFGVNGLVDLPLGFSVSTLGKFRSGRPMEPLAGGDFNGDNTPFPDRAFVAPGVSFQRNSFRDQRQYTVDLRVAKKFKLPREGMSLNFTADFFNVFDFADILFISSTPDFRIPTDVYGAGVSSSTGMPIPASSGFQLLKSPSNCGNNPAKGLNPSCFNTFTSPGSPLTIQLGARFQF
jgi:hypothetical protein